jgi:hypothetical protein
MSDITHSEDEEIAASVVQKMSLGKYICNKI